MLKNINERTAIPPTIKNARIHSLRGFPCRYLDEIISACKKVERPGLYIMVLVILMHSCSASTTTTFDTTGEKLQNIENKIDRILMEQNRGNNNEKETN